MFQARCNNVSNGRVGIIPAAVGEPAANFTPARPADHLRVRRTVFRRRRDRQGGVQTPDHGDALQFCAGFRPFQNIRQRLFALGRCHCDRSSSQAGAPEIVEAVEHSRVQICLDFVTRRPGAAKNAFAASITTRRPQRTNPSPAAGRHRDRVKSPIRNFCVAICRSPSS